MMSLLKYGIFLLMYGFLGLIGFNIVLSWFPMLANLKVFRFLRRITDTFMEPFHGFLVIGMFDFTPIIGIAIFEFIIRLYAFLMGLSSSLI